MASTRDATTPMTTAKTAGTDNNDRLRLWLGALIILAAFVFIGLALAAALQKWQASTDVTAVLGSITSIVGTLAGLFFGVQVGAQGKEKAEEARAKSEDKAVKLAAALNIGDPATKETLRLFGADIFRQ